MRSTVRIGMLAVLVLFGIKQVLLRADTPQTVAPESVGLSAEKLAQIRETLNTFVAEERLAGAVTLVARRGKVAWFDAGGWQDREKRIPLTKDSIFRIASMTKPITSAAVMMLYDDGEFQLDDPVSKFIPELAKMKVLTTKDGKDEIVDATRQITIRHLLTHTAGLTYHWDQKVGNQYTELGITHGLIYDPDTIGDSVKKLSMVPLLHEPGAQFTYGLNTDVLGYLVEVISGTTFDAFLRERLCDPLAMHDTRFMLDDKQLERLAVVYRSDENGKAVAETRDEVIESNYLHYTTNYPGLQQTYYSGGGGLCSTAADYYRFCQMLLDHGQASQRQLLKAETVDLMTSPGYKTPGDNQEGNGFGLGFGVRRAPLDANTPQARGMYFWGGFFYTSFFVDPERELIAISMAQLHPAVNVDWGDQFTSLVYAALTD